MPIYSDYFNMVLNHMADEYAVDISVFYMDNRDWIEKMGETHEKNHYPFNDKK